jgi:hypothetical protein
MKPRLAALIGVTFVVVAVVFYLLPYLTNGHIDYAGLTMILALSVAMSMMFYVLMAGTPRDS